MTIDFAKIAPYLKDPLILIGFCLFLGFLFARSIIKAGIIPQLSRTFGYKILQRILLYGFIIALALIALGFGLKYRELSQKEQANSVRLLDQELTGNLEVIAELKKNTETIINVTSTVSKVLRTPGLKLLAALFPAENLDPKALVPASADLASQALEAALNKGLINDELERKKFSAAAAAILGTIKRTQSTIRSLADPAETRYVLKSEIWKSELPILRKINIINVTQFQAAYGEMTLARTNYNIVVLRCLDYLAAVSAFFDPKDHRITRQSLAAVLAAERLFVQVSTEYANQLLGNLKVIAALDKTIRVRTSKL